MRRRACSTVMSMKLYARSMNLSFELDMARAVKTELRPRLQTRFHAKCSSIKWHLSSINKSATAYAPSELMLFWFKKRLYSVLLPLKASQRSMTPFEPSWLQLKSRSLTVVLSINPWASAIAPSTFKQFPLRLRACSLDGYSRSWGTQKMASSASCMSFRFSCLTELGISLQSCSMRFEDIEHLSSVNMDCDEVG